MAIELHSFRDLLVRVLGRIRLGAGKTYRRALIVKWIEARLGYERGPAL